MRDIDEAASNQSKWDLTYATSLVLIRDAAKALAAAHLGLIQLGMAQEAAHAMIGAKHAETTAKRVRDGYEGLVGDLRFPNRFTREGKGK